MRAPLKSGHALAAVALVAAALALGSSQDGGARPGASVEEHEVGLRAEPAMPTPAAALIGPAAPLSGPLASAPNGPPAAIPNERHEFYFTRAIYSSGRGRRGWGGRGRGSWATDYPEADRHFAEVIERTVGLDAYDWENAVSLSDPELRRYPIIYALEVGAMALTQEEIHGLRDYLNAGGFLIIDDFWGTREWQVFEYNMRMVLPGRPIVELEMDHPVFKIFYEIDQVLQVPNVRQGYYGGPTWEKDGYTPHVRGIFDGDGRLMVAINWNTDLGDAWEWSDDPFYPMKYSTFAYEMGANMIVYAMSH